MMRAAQVNSATVLRAADCPMCGIPLDSQHFDDSKLEAAPGVGQQVVLARFELPPQYCGVLRFFAQFTDAHAKDPSQVATPGLQWLILMNKRPLYPYVSFEHIINPWGNGSFEVSLRLDESATLEFVVRRLSENADVKQVGGRLMGRYWYNPIYG
jgi:hypothetical protein